MVDYGKPIKIFYSNLILSGISLSVEAGKLHVNANGVAMPPTLQDEIRKRAAHLVDLLTPDPPAALQPYFGRLLSVDDLELAIAAAREENVLLESTLINGGWLLEIPKQGYPSQDDPRWAMLNNLLNRYDVTPEEITEAMRLGAALGVTVIRERTYLY